MQGSPDPLDLDNVPPKNTHTPMELTSSKIWKKKNLFSVSAYEIVYGLRCIWINETWTFSDKEDVSVSQINIDLLSEIPSNL